MILEKTDKLLQDASFYSMLLDVGISVLIFLIR